MQREFNRKSLFSERKQPRVHEENGIVLDFLQHGHLKDPSRRPVAQVIGIEHLSILEVAPKKGVFLKPLEKVYIGINKRDKIHHIIKKLEYDELTETAKITLKDIIKKKIEDQADMVLKFFNECGPVSTRQHQLELIPGIGKKHMWAIIEEREKKPFESLDDLKNRVASIPDPVKAVMKRAINELEGIDKYKVILPRLNLKEEEA
jgi:putative nucleotide binding protein